MLERNDQNAEAVRRSVNRLGSIRKAVRAAMPNATEEEFNAWRVWFVGWRKHQGVEVHGRKRTRLGRARRNVGATGEETQP